ncbi:MAG: zinc-binding dehydrogenase [Chloroflexota bacterium]
MRAVLLREPGEPDVLNLETVPDPRPRAGEVLVRLKAAAVNHRDLYIRKGMQLRDSLPLILGSDGAGVVVDVGEGVTTIAPGAEVVIYPVLADNTCPYCLAGEQEMCDSFRILGGPDSGTYAEYITVPAINLYHKPAAFSWEEAAAFPLTALTAYRMVMDRAQLRAGETVLIHGIGGAVAIFALQLARATGARAIVTSSSDEKLARAEPLGAQALVNYRKSDVLAEVRRFTGGRGVDVVVDTVGAATWQLSLQAVRKGGRIALCGVTTGSQADTTLRHIYWNQIAIVGSTMGSQSEFARVLALCESGALKPIVDVVLPLAGAAQGHRRLEEQAQFGKVVLRTQ